MFAYNDQKQSKTFMIIQKDIRIEAFVDEMNGHYDHTDLTCVANFLIQKPSNDIDMQFKIYNYILRVSSRNK